MYPLVQIGPFRLSSGGLLLLLSILVGSMLLSRVAQSRGGAKLARQADTCFYPLLSGALVGYLWCRTKGYDELALADCAVLVLPVTQAIASLGLLLSGEAFGMP